MIYRATLQYRLRLPPTHPEPSLTCPCFTLFAHCHRLVLLGSRRSTVKISVFHKHSQPRVRVLVLMALAVELGMDHDLPSRLTAPKLSGRIENNVAIKAIEFESLGPLRRINRLSFFVFSVTAQGGLHNNVDHQAVEPRKLIASDPSDRHGGNLHAQRGSLVGIRAQGL